ETLEVVANFGDTIRLSLDLTNPALLDAKETNQFGVVTDFLAVPLTQITAIQVDATAGNVTLDVDESAGVIVLPNPVSANCALQFNGAANDTFLVDDSLDTATEKVTLGTDQIVGLGMSMCYNTLGKVQFKGGANSQDFDVFTLTNTDASVTTELDLGSGFNR